MAADTQQQGRRIDHLSRHKPIPAGHVSDRQSVYWVDREPLGPPTVMAMTPRLEVLSKSRQLVAAYQFNRDRSFHMDNEPFYYEIKPTNKNVPEASPRVQALSAHKTLHTEYGYDRELPLEAGKPKEASPRVQELARSKTELWEKKGGWPNTHIFYDYLPQPVSDTARKATASARIESLADHKKIPPTFKPERSIRWAIAEQALKINATLRVCQLARPRSRSMVRDDGWDPYVVPKAARYAQITPRVEELSAPLPRKQRSKKAV